MRVQKIVLKTREGDKEKVVAEIQFDSEVVLLFSHYFASGGSPSLEEIKKFVVSLKRKVKPPNAVDDPAVMLKIFDAIGKAMEKLNEEAKKIEVVIE